jgi:hypothetical protein
MLTYLFIDTCPSKGNRIERRHKISGLKGKDKECWLLPEPWFIRAGAYPSFCSIKRLGALLLWMGCWSIADYLPSYYRYLLFKDSWAKRSK